jgi:PAS domain S-box-containing protein
MSQTPGSLRPSPQAQAAKLHGILVSAVTAIITIDERGIIENANPATERLFGYSDAELVGKNVKMLMPEPYRAEHDGYIESYIATGERKIIGIGREVSGRRKDGKVFPLHLSVSEFEADGKRYFTGMIYDISDQRHVEEALRETERRLAQAQKMEAVGQLTGGIAHDFNNLLLVVSGNLELLEPRLTSEEALILLKEAQDAVALGAKLTDQLLTFARRRHLDAHVIQLNVLVVNTADMLRRTLGEHIRLSTSLAADAWSTRADPDQFQSAIVNMAVNARDAMPKGGKLVIETRNTLLEPGELEQQDVQPGDYVRLTISDTGDGMPPEVRDRVFEPFFTTKEKGRGTGLGLAMVYGFVKQSGGHVTIYSEPGLGTTLNLYFPRSADTAMQEGTAAGDGDAVTDARQTILVVEDDARVRNLTIKRLKLIGHNVLEASDGPSALEVLKRGEPVDLVFTDLIMPGGLSGRDVALRAREIRPGIKVLLTSGYAEELVRGAELQRENLKVLRKPYRQADLVAALRDVLTGGPAGAP